MPKGAITPERGCLQFRMFLRSPVAYKNREMAIGLANWRPLRKPPPWERVQFRSQTEAKTAPVAWAALPVNLLMRGSDGPDAQGVGTRFCLTEDKSVSEEKPRRGTQKRSGTEGSPGKWACAEVPGARGRCREAAGIRPGKARVREQASHKRP